MDFSKLTGDQTLAYLAGSCRAHALACIRLARAAVGGETKKLYVNWARAEHHASLRYLRKIRELA